MNFHPDYHGCPGCGEFEDRDCRCTGADYAPVPSGLHARLAAQSPVRCICTGHEPDPRCPLHGVAIIRLASIRLPFDFAEWGDRVVRYAS